MQPRMTRFLLHVNSDTPAVHFLTRYNYLYIITDCSGSGELTLSYFMNPVKPAVLALSVS